MFSIGDFARYGRVSIRMLRHYDSLGLLTPARVDPSTGYRHYRAAQLARLNRIVALKDLGFSLAEVARLLTDEVGTDELRGLLSGRQVELESRIVADRARLRQVEARLRMIESEGRMSVDEIVVKRIPAVRVAELTAVAAGFEPDAIGPVIGPLYEDLCARLATAGVAIVGPAIAYYETAPGGVIVHAALPVNVEPVAGQGFAVVDLPEVESAATVLHRGPMDDVMPSVQALAAWIEANGYRSAGSPRELYLESSADGCVAVVTELQEPISR